MTSTLKCSPRYVKICSMADKKDKEYKPLVTRSEMKKRAAHAGTSMRWARAWRRNTTRSRLKKIMEMISISE